MLTDTEEKALQEWIDNHEEEAILKALKELIANNTRLLNYFENEEDEVTDE